MTNTERNERFLGRIKFLNFKHPQENLTNLYRNVVKTCGPDGESIAHIPTSLERFIREVDKFIFRAQRDEYARPIIKCALRVRRQLSKVPASVTEQPSRLQLLQKIKELERQVTKSISPSEHETISEATKNYLIGLKLSLDNLMSQKDIGNVLSPDRIRILKSDLVYLQKREHLFT